MTPRPRLASLVVFLVTSLLVLAPAGCSHAPAPSPTAATHAPSSPADTVHAILATADWAVPAARVVVALLGLPADVRAYVDATLDRLAIDALATLRRTYSQYRARGGGDGSCELYAATGAFVEAVHGVAVVLARGDVLAPGYQLPAEFLRMLTSAAGVLDELSPGCPAGATGDDAGLARGTATLRRVAGVADEARQRGVVLRPFPPLARDSD